MAKSYVTKFTEYVAQQRDNLEKTLKGKKVSINSNDTLQTLVSKVNEINLEYSKAVEFYERDENLPNIDELFDNDPLRAVNGGTYLYCAYAICKLDENNAVSINTSLSDHVIFVSDGTEYQYSGYGTKHIVQESGIYTTLNNEKFCLLKAYSSTSSSSGIGGNIVELIEDRMSVGLTYGKSYNVAGVTTYSPTINYLRFECSNVDNSQVAAASYSFTDTIKDCIVINGSIPYSTLQIIPPKQALILNCSIVNTNVTSGSSVSFTLQKFNGQTAPFKCVNVKLPYCDVSYTATVQEIFSTNVFVPDSVGKLLFRGGYGSSYSWARDLESLHLGNGINTFTIYGSSTSSADAYAFGARMEKVSVSPNSFIINTSALTLNFAYAMLNRESVLNLINNLADRKEMTANVLKLSAYSKSLVSEDELAILTNKNWTIS